MTWTHIKAIFKHIQNHRDVKMKTSVPSPTTARTFDGGETMCRLSMCRLSMCRLSMCRLSMCRLSMCRLSM
ncbi:hypothetical protein EYF80_057008 [Liparis tanakae]|uniref:Uncharacterized protein n=1 Tax=Liparis tanakae TaxID=230148 RepID=A0A4Z2EVG0_9TELE|nr:hypothetical protein EYF80_057008 [Liparis tanakae]